MSQKTEDGKRFPMSFRTTAALRDKIGDAAAVSGRSVAQELEFRLEASFHSDERIGDLQDRIRELETSARSGRETTAALMSSLQAMNIELILDAGSSRGGLTPAARNLDVAIKRVRQAFSKEEPEINITAAEQPPLTERQAILRGLDAIGNHLRALDERMEHIEQARKKDDAA
jgi:hypothetical protein